MEYYVEFRLQGDRYGNGYGNGHTLSGGESVQDMEKVSESASETVFKGKKGHLLHCCHREKNVGNGSVTECSVVFENTTDEKLRLELLSSFAIKGLKADRIHRARSFWSAEGRLLSQDLTDLNMEMSWAKHGLRVEKFGQVGTMPVRKWFPFLVLEDSENGNFLGVQLYCASSWQIEVLRRDETYYIQGGIADRDFGQWAKDIAPGESFETPKAVVAEGSSLLEVCDKLVKAQNPRISPVDRDMPVIFNEYCTTWGNPTFPKLEKIAKKLQGSGVKYLVIDSGWYKDSSDEWYQTIGDWEVNKDLFPDGIDKVADMIKSYGMIPGIWFEFENVAVKSKIYSDVEHLQKRDGIPVEVGDARFFDMRQQWVQDYLDKKVVGLLRDNGFGYIKVDYNETFGAGVDGAESYGEGVRASVEGTRRFFKHMTDELPDLVIENCSSGGHRLEPSMMELSSMASFSDAHECKCIPLIAANLHRLIRPEQRQIWAVLRAEDDVDRIKYIIVSAFLGRLCFSGDIFDLSQEKWSLVPESIGFYDRVKHIIRDGITDVIETNAKEYQNPKGYQIVRRSLGDEELLVVHTFEGGANPPIERFLEGREVVEAFGSELDGDFRGRVIHVRKK
ncbi:MAG: alpha-galactosidase [Butyrivibrio sp.]|nr:alpha-galactosidase [Butyrivibrio sp.]